MADNMIELVASLNVDGSAEQINKVDIPLLKDKIEAIKIKCELDTENISSIRTQLSNIRTTVPQIDLGVGINSSDVQQRVAQTVSVIQQNLDRNAATANVNFNFNQAEIERFTNALTSLRVQGVDMEQLQQRLQNLGITIEKITPSFTQAARDGEKFLSTLSIKGIDSAGNLVTYIENFDRRTHNFQNATLKVEESFAKIRKAEEAVKSETEAVQKAMNDFLKLQGQFDLYNKKFGSEQSLQPQFSELQNLIDSFDNAAPLENQRESLIRIDNALKLIKVDIDNLGEVSAQINAQTVENSERIIEGLKEQYRASEDVKNITTDWTKNADNDLTGFVLNVQKATGEVERFRYAFDESGNAELLGSLGTDRGTTQALEKATKAANTLERQMINLKAAADDASAPRPITSEESINRVAQAYKNAETAIGNLRVANASTFEELNNEAKKAVDELNNVIKAQRNADTAATKLRAKPIETVKADELSNLDKFVTTISNSAIPDVTNLTRRVEELRSELSEVNDKQGLVDYLNKFTNVESDFKALVAQAKAVKGALRDLDNLSNNALFQKNKSDPQVSSTLSDIENIRKEYGQLFAEIGNAKAPEDLQKISNKLAELKPQFDKVVNSANQFKTALKVENIDEGLANRIKRLTADINSYASANKRATESTKQMTSGRSFADEWARITSVMAKGADLTDRELKDLSADMLVFRKEAQAAGLAGASAFEKFGNAFKTISTYVSANQIINMVISQIRSAVTELQTVDDRLTEISKTSDRTVESLRSLGETAFDTASKYGRTASDYLLGVQEMSRAGFNERQSEDMAELTILAQAAGDMTADLANQYLIATNAAYDYNGSIAELTDTLDRQNYVTNHYALSMNDLAEATKIAASQAAQSGIGIDEMTAALSTMIATTQQGGEIAARSLRGILMNIQMVKGEVGDGEEDITAESLSKYEKAAADLGVSLKEVRNGAVSLRDPMVVLDELATAFNKEADDSIKKANLISAIGGKYRGNQLSALLSNWGTYKDILNTFNSEQAVGSAMTEAEKSANNWAGSLNKVKNSWSELVNSFINSDNAITVIQSVDKIIQNLTDSAATGGLKILSDAITGLIKLVGDLTDKFGTFPTLLASVGAVGSFNKMGFFKVVEDDATKGGNAITLFGKKLKDVIKDYKEADAGKNKISQALSGMMGFNQSDSSAIEKYNSLIENGVDKTEAFEKSMLGASNGAKSFVLSSKAATAGITGLSISEKVATVATEALGIALNTALSFVIGSLIQAIITGITKLVNAEKEAQEKAEELRREATETAKSYKDEVESLSNLTTEYIKLATTTSDLSTQKEKLLGIQDKINDGFASEKEKVDLLNGSLSENLRLLDEQEYKEAKRTISELEPQYEEFQKLSNKEGNYFLLNDADKKNAKNVAENIEREFVDFFNATTDYYEAEWVDAFTGEQRSAYVNLLSLRQPLDEISVAGQSYAEVLDNLNLIIDSYREWEGHNNDTLKSLNALRDKYDELAQSENEVTTAYETAQKSIQDYNDVFNSDASQRISEILEDAKELSTTLNSSTSGTEKYNAIQQLSDLEKEARRLAGTNAVLKNDVDVVFNAINTGSQSSIKSIGDLRSAWFESLEDIQKNTISNIDKIDKALKTVVDGNNLSSSDFWELAKLDTDNIIRSISLVNGEYKLSQQELVNLKDQYIQKQIESLKVTQAQIKADEVEARQALVLAKKKLTDKSLFDTVKRGSANLNNPAYRAYLDEVNADIEKAENNVKELGDEWTRNNILIRELNSRLGFSVEQTKALAETYKKNFTDAIDKQIDKVNDRKQALEDEKTVLNEQLEVLEEQQKALEETIEQYKTVSNVIKKAIDEETNALKEQQKAEEDAVQARIDALKKSRETKEEETELAEKQLAVQEKLRDLEKARNNKVRTYSSDRGWHYEADKEAVANAETAYSDARKAYDEFIEKRSYESQLKALESEKDLISKNYEGMIQAYEDYYTEYEKILNEQTDAENEQLANQILGVDWRERIKNRDTNILNKFKANFNSYNSQLKNLVDNEIAALKNSIKAKDEQIKALDKEINAWNKYKNDLENDINEINSKYEDMQNGLDGLKYANDLSLSNIEVRMWDFKEHYKAYMDEAISKARELRDASSEDIDTSAIDEWAVKWEKMMDAINRFREQGIGIQSESDARYYAGEKIISFGGKTTASQARSSYITPQRSQQLYNLVDSGDLAINAADKILQSIKPSSINPNTNTTMNENRTININELTIKADNPKQFHDQFEKEMGQYWKIKLTENYVK